MVCWRQFRRFFKPKGLVILLLLGLSFCIGAKEIPLTLKSGDAEVSALDVGSRLEISFVIPKNRTPSLKIENPSFGSSLSYLGGPYYTPVLVSDNDGNETEHTRVAYIFKTRSPGILVIDSYVATDGIDIFTTPKRVLKVSDKGYIPPNLRWVIPETKIYVGQAVPLILEMYNLQEIRIPESVDMVSAAGLIFEQVQGLTKIVEEEIDGVTLYRLPVAEYFVTPSRPGTLFIPENFVSIDNRQLRAGAVRLNVLQVPSEVRGTGGVGSFTMDTVYPKDSIDIDEDFAVSIILEGYGNFTYFKFPNAVGENFILKNTEIESDLFAGLIGYEGYMKKTFYFSAKETGSHSLQIEGFTWYDPSSDQYYSVPDSEWRINVRESEMLHSDNGEDSLPDLIEKDMWWQYQDYHLFLNPVFYVSLLPGFLILLILVLKQRGFFKFFFASIIFAIFSCAPVYEAGHLDGVIATSHTNYSNGNFKEAHALYENFTREWPANAAVWYNRAICAKADANTADAVFSLKKALQLRPHDMQIHELLDQVELQAGLERQIPRPFFMHIDELVIILIVGINLLCIIAGMMYVRNRTYLALSLALAWLIIGISAAGVIISFTDTLSQKAVIRDHNVPLKTIPREESGDYLRLPEGTNVYIRYQEGPYYLIETAYGRQGWVGEDSLLRE